MPLKKSPKLESEPHTSGTSAVFEHNIPFQQKLIPII